MDRLSVFGKITRVEKQADGTLYVEGTAATDHEIGGKIVPADTMRRALPGYLKFPTIREMHEPWAAGRTAAADVGDDGVTRIATKIVDKDAIQKVETRVYNGFSINGNILKRNANDSRVVDEFELIEISLVDVPFDPDCTFSLVRVRNNMPSEATDAQPKTETAPAAPPTAPTTPEATSAAAPAPVVETKTETVTRAVEFQAKPAEPVATAPETKPADPPAPAAVVDRKVERAKLLEQSKVLRSTEVWDAQAALDALKIVESLLAWESSEPEKEPPEQIADLKACVEKLRSFIASEIKEGAEKVEQSKKVEGEALTRAKAAEDACSQAGEALKRIIGERDELVKRCAVAELELQRKGILRVVPVEKGQDTGGDLPKPEQEAEPKTAREAITRSLRAPKLITDPKDLLH